jgi:predicted nucleic acid-binding protein
VTPLKRPLVAADSNIPIDLAIPEEFALDALAIIRARICPARIIITPTALQELVFMWKHFSDPTKREKARRGLVEMREHGLDAVNLIPVEHGIVERVAERLERAELLPSSERHDSLILAEASLLGCSILLTSDAHLRGIDFQKASLLLRQFDLSMPVIATPRELIAKFG